VHRVHGDVIDNPMIKRWPDIKHFYEELVGLGAPLCGMLRLVEQIESSPYQHGIRGWTSMHDLAITQSIERNYPDTEPHLRISPRYDGRLEFRYIDTYIAPRQWARTIDERDAFVRLERFFDQLHWFSRT